MSKDVNYTEVKVWTRERHDQQVYMFYYKDELVGLNFHHGTSELDASYHEPDTTLFNTFRWIRQHRIDDNRPLKSDKKMIAKAIRIWLKYVIKYYNINE